MESEDIIQDGQNSPYSDNDLGNTILWYADLKCTVLVAKEFEWINLYFLGEGKNQL